MEEWGTGAHTTRHCKVANASPDEKVQRAVALLDVMLITDNLTSRATEVACSEGGKESHQNHMYILYTHSKHMHNAIHIHILYAYKHKPVCTSIVDIRTSLIQTS